MPLSRLISERSAVNNATRATAQLVSAGKTHHCSASTNLTLGTGGVPPRLLQSITVSWPNDANVFMFEYE
jgi:hypothetical protein